MNKMFLGFDIIEFIPYNNQSFDDKDIIYTKIYEWFLKIYSSTHVDILEIKKLASFILFLPYNANELSLSHRNYYISILNFCIYMISKQGLTRSDMIALKIQNIGFEGIFKNKF